MPKVSRKKANRAKKAHQSSPIDLNKVNSLFKSLQDSSPALSPIDTSNKTKEKDKKRKKSIFNS